MQQTPIIVTNLVINILMTILLIKLNADGNEKHADENTLSFALWWGITFVVQFVANLSFAIYFFVKKENEIGRAFLFTMVLLVFLACASIFILSAVGIN